MLKNYFKIVMRTIARNKVYSFINIWGLACGMSASLLILLWINDELQFDNFHQNSANLYRVLENQHYAGGTIMTTSATPGPMAPYIKEKYPEIELASRFTWEERRLFEFGTQSFYQVGRFVDADFLKMFTFPLVKGDIQTALKDPNSIIISKEMSQRLFGNEEPMGKILEMDDTTSLVVSGVLDEIPSNSSIKFDYLISFDFYLKGNEGWLGQWGNNNIRTFITLANGTDAEQFNAKFKDELDLHNGEDNNIKLFTQRFSESYIYSKFDNGQLVGGRIEQVKIFTIVAVLILFIACINFMNLATAQASKRAKEVGMRKVIGAQKEQLISQFLGESVVFTMLAAIISLALVYLLLPAFNALSDKSMSLNLIDQNILLLFVGVILFTGIASGSYPAIYLSKFEPAAVLKGAFKTSKGAIFFRKSLVVFQFMLSIVLIVSTLVVYRQFQFAQNKELGFDRNNAFFFWMQGDMGNRIETIRQQLLTDNSIEFVGASGQNPINVGNSSWGFEWTGKDPETRILFTNMSVNPDFVSALGLEIIEGRNFDPNRISDTANFIINETAAKKMGLENPVGEPLTMWGTRKGQIIGVVKDYHFRSLHEEIEPLILFYNPNWLNALLIRHKDGLTQQALTKTEEIFKQYAPAYPFEFEMLANTWDEVHQSEKKIMELFQYFAILSIFISCLGLFGLAAFSAEQRTKEIGVRKILGASVPSLTSLMIKDFALLVLIASIIACPLSWYLMNEWLSNFVYRIEVGYITLALATIAAFVIAVITVSYHALKASILNPVKSLRYE